MPPTAMYTNDRCFILICTDSRSALQKLERGPCYQTGMLECEVWKAISALVDAHPQCETHFQYVPGHAGVEQNTAADDAAGRAAEYYRDCPDEAGDGAGVPLELAKALWTAHERSCDETGECPEGVPAGYAWRRATEGGAPTMPPLRHTSRATRTL